MSGKFILEESQLLKIIAGQTGIGNIHGGGGGGGSFVVNAINSTLLVLQVGAAVLVDTRKQQSILIYRTEKML